MKAWLSVFKEGISLQNPLTILMIGLCSVLAVSAQFEGSFFMSIAVMFVLVMSNVIISAIRRFVPDQVRIPIFIVVIASFVTIVDLTMKAYVPDVYQFLGVWIPLIVVNCIVLGRAEAFAYHNGVWLSIADGLGMGLGYTIVICILGFARELFGTGAIYLKSLAPLVPALAVKPVLAMPDWYPPPNILVLFPGAFILFGLIIAASQAINRRLAEKEVSS